MAEYIEKWSVVNKLIDLENEFQQYKPFHGFEHAMYRKLCEAEITIGKTTAADVVEVKHGLWILTLVSSPDYYGLVFGWKCSECGYHFEDRSKHRKTPRFMKYCPNCGARMDGADNG